MEQPSGPGSFKLIAVSVDNRGRRSVPDTVHIKITGASSTPGRPSTLPGSFNLHQNYPNPFNPETVIRYEIPEKSRVGITIYNTMGCPVKTLVDGAQAPGSYSVVWNGFDDAGWGMPSGIYVCRMSAECSGQKKSAVRKMALLK